MDSHPLFDHSLPVGMVSADAPRYPSAPGGHEAMKADLDAMGAQYEETQGRYHHPERSLLVYGLPRDQLFALGRKYGQEAVIHNEGGKREFIYTNGPKAGFFHPGLPTHDHWPEDAEPPEDYYTKVPGAGYVRLHFDFDQLHRAPVMPGAPQPAPLAPQPQPVAKRELGYRLYKAFGGLSMARKPYAHPHAYDWHDHHTDHHYLGHGPGGVLVSSHLRKDEPAAHPHMDAPPKNEQAAGVGVSTYHQYALPFGKIDQKAKQSGGSNLFHYDYRGKAQQVNDLLAHHGFQAYYAGGKYGKPDLANRNYNTKHLMVYDPTPKSGGDFGEHEYTDNWRKVHELAHALTYPELNQIYGEGRRIGKLGHHRTTREALRAVHWEWLAAHKQRELSRQLGVEVPDDVFNREVNTVMHDAAHRAVTGKFTEPSSEGFTPHSHLVPLETSLGLVREAARNLGLTGLHDVLKKSEENSVADDKKLSVPQALHGLYNGLSGLIGDFEQKCLELRKAESDALAKVAPPGWSEETMHKLKRKYGTESAFKIAWAAHNKHGGDHKKAEADMTKNLGNPAAYGPQGPAAMGAPPPAATTPPMVKAEMCKACGMEKAASHDCDEVERYAKGEIKPTYTSREESVRQRQELAARGKMVDVPSISPEKAKRDPLKVKKDEDDYSEPQECPHCGGEGHELGALGSRKHYRCRNCGGDFSQEPPKPASKPAKKAEKNPEVPVVNTLPAGSDPEGPQKDEGVRPDDKKSKKAPKNEGNGDDLNKASLATGATAAPTAPKAAVPKMPKLPKLPGPAKLPKPPAMGAGTPSPVAKRMQEPSPAVPTQKAELEKASPIVAARMAANREAAKKKRAQTSTVTVQADTQPSADQQAANLSTHLGKAVMLPGVKRAIPLDPTWSPASKQLAPTPSPFAAPPAPPLSATVGVAAPMKKPVTLPGLKPPPAAARPGATPPPIPAAVKPAVKPVK